MEGGYYRLRVRDLNILINEIVKVGEITTQQAILAGIIYRLDAAHYRDVLRAIVKIVNKAASEMENGRLSRALVQGADHVFFEKRIEKIICKDEEVTQ